MIIRSFRRMALRLGLLGAFAAGAGLAHAAEDGFSTRDVGPWDLKLAEGKRECRMVLRADVTGPGYGVGMPVGCHLAFPFLVNVKMWGEADDGKLQLEDAKGQLLVAFEPGAEGVLTGTDPSGQSLQFVPTGQHRLTVLKTVVKPLSPAEAEARTTRIEAVKAAATLPRPSISEMAGHYAVLRKLDKDTGCMVTLDDKTRGPGNTLKANLSPACRDQGIVIFDPVGWQLQAGQLVLTARKGHTAKLDMLGEGSWMKDAGAGKILSLKKMQAP